MGEMIGRILMVILGQIEVGLIMTGIMGTHIRKRKKWLIVGTLLLVMICALYVTPWADSFVVLTVRVFLPPIIFLMWMEGGIVRNLMIYICSVAYTGLPGFCLNLAAIWILKKPISELGQSHIYQIARESLIIILIWIIARRLKRTKYKDIIGELPTKYFVIGSICAISASLMKSFLQEIMGVHETDTLTDIIIGCTVIVIIAFYAVGIVIAVVNSLKTRYREESNSKEEYLRITREYVQNIRQNARETRKLRHDMREHINVLNYYMEKNQYEEAKKYLKDLQDYMGQAIQRELSVNHEIVDAILNEYYWQSQKNGIKWKVEGALPPDLNISDFDLCTIFSNILRNSVEACMKLQGERYINLEIRTLKEQLIIEVTNPVKEPVDIEKLGTITSKKDIKNHGYGIANIRTMVERNHGELSFENQEKSFVVEIIFAKRV